MFGYNLTSAGVTLPVGIMLPFAGASAPTGYLVCDGAAINRIIYADLFAIVGTTYGVGDGSTTFNLPNMVDKHPIGVGTRLLGNTGGALDHIHSGPSHQHTYNTVIEHNHPLSANPAYVVNMEDPWTTAFVMCQHASGIYKFLIDGGEDGAGMADGNGIAWFDTEDTHTHTVSNTGSASGTTSLDGTQNTGVANAPYLALNYIIKI